MAGAFAPYDQGLPHMFPVLMTTNPSALRHSFLPFLPAENTVDMNILRAFLPIAGDC